MAFYDHDLHIHSYISPCAADPAQTTERILRYAEENRLHTICLTDHFWDERIPYPLNPAHAGGYTFERLSTVKPLPQSDTVRFLFGCEAEMDKEDTIAIVDERIDEFDFIVVPTTHFHNGMSLKEEETTSVNSRAVAWVRKFDALLNSRLPLERVGIAHLTTSLIAPTREQFLAVLDALPETELYRLFKRSAEVGLGIELNTDGMNYAEEEKDVMLKPFIIAKECGCKFYCGSDAHRPAGLERAKGIFEKAIAALGLTEADKFVLKENA